jgi:GMP synthase-like glutamine amidotransferase
MQTTRMRPTVLVIQNEKWEGPGLVSLYARAAGVDLDTVELFHKSSRAQELPFDKLEGGAYSAVVSLGSPSTAYIPETNPRHNDLVRLFKLIRKQKTHSFNICYSMQLFSIVHGGKVVKNPRGKEVGFCEVRPTAEGKSDPVIGPIGPYSTLQWHGDVVEELPRGAVLLASSKKTKNQTAVLDRMHYLVQADGQAAFPSMVRSWLRHDGKWATQGTGLKADQLVREAVEHEAHFRSAFLRIFGNFLGLALSKSR